MITMAADGGMFILNMSWWNTGGGVTLNLGGDVWLQVPGHHSPPPLQHQQELGLPYISADTPPGGDSAEVLTFHVVLVRKWLKIVLNTTYYVMVRTTTVRCLLFFFTSIPLNSWTLDFLFSLLWSCNKSWDSNQTSLNSCQRYWCKMYRPSMSCHPPESREGGWMLQQGAFFTFNPPPQTIRTISYFTSEFLTGLRTIPFFILSIISSTALAFRSTSGV